jgi:hypothetical protein
MKTRSKYILSFVVIIQIILISTYQWSCRSSRINPENITDTITTNMRNQGWDIELHFHRGQNHNHPLMAIWITDTSNRYLESLYPAESIAKGVFDHGDKTTDKWLPGPLRRPAALPVWSHSRNIREDDGLFVPGKETPMPDAVTGATPQNSFILKTRTNSKKPAVFIVWFEINQAWDWNEHWTNNKYPDDEEYKTSCQPALVYQVVVNTTDLQSHYDLKLIGHGHYSGKDGNIYKNLSTITTAKDITKSISLFVK